MSRVRCKECGARLEFYDGENWPCDWGGPFPVDGCLSKRGCGKWNGSFHIETPGWEESTWYGREETEERGVGGGLTFGTVEARLRNVYRVGANSADKEQER